MLTRKITHSNFFCLSRSLTSRPAWCFLLTWLGITQTICWAGNAGLLSACSLQVTQTPTDWHTNANRRLCLSDGGESSHSALSFSAALPCWDLKSGSSWRKLLVVPFFFVMTNLSQLLQCQQSASTSLLPLDEKSQELMWEVIVWRHFQDSRLGFYEWRHEDSRVKVILKTCCGFCLSVFNETLEWKQHQLKDLKTFHRNFEEAQSFQQDWKNMTTIINTIMKRNSNKHRWILEASNFNFIQMSTKMNVLVKTACYPTIILMAK